MRVSRHRGGADGSIEGKTPEGKKPAGASGVKQTRKAQGGESPRGGAKPRGGNEPGGGNPGKMWTPSADGVKWQETPWKGPASSDDPVGRVGHTLEGSQIS